MNMEGSSVGLPSFLGKLLMFATRRFSGRGFLMLVVFSVCFCLASFIRCGDGVKGRIVEINSLEEINEIVQGQSSCVLQISLEGCPYCNALDYAMQDLLARYPIILYRYEVPIEREGYEREALLALFEDFPWFPSIQYVSNEGATERMELGEDLSGLEDGIKEWFYLGRFRELG